MCNISGQEDTKMVKLVECKADSDVVAMRVRDFTGEVQVEIQDDERQPDDPFESNTLITAKLLPSQAIRLARALLTAAGASGNVDGNVTRYTFID
jgi:hypothetical protein